MKRSFCAASLLTSGLLLGLPACTPTATSPQPSPTASIPPSAATASPEATASAEPTASPTASPSAEGPAATAPTPTPNPSAAASTTVNLPDGSRLQLSLPSRFLNNQGEGVQLQAQLLDAAGQPLPLGDLQLRFSSSRPQDFAVDDKGLLTALVEEGFSYISVEVVGTEVRASQLVSISVGVGGSSGGGAGITNNQTQTPTITGFTPNSGTPEITVTITGERLIGATEVRFNGVIAPIFQVESDTKMTVTVPVGITSGSITVTTPRGTATSAASFFLTPFLTALNPTSGIIAGGTTVILTGNHLSGTTGVSFGGTAATNFTVNSNTQITAIAPARPLGPAQVTVTTPGGTSGGRTYTYTPTVVFVNANVVGGANDGSSWPNAYTSLQTALTNATVPSDIWIAAGSYRPTAANGDRNATFQLRSNINVYGGFNGTEFQLSQRNATANVVNLSGDLNNNDNPVLNAIDAVANPANVGRAENSFHVVTGANNVTLDGVTIRGGNIANGDPAANTNGAGMLNNGVSPTLNNVRFTHNVVFQRGGGMRNENGAAPVLTQVTFLENAATNGGGGGISNNNASPTLSQVTLTQNTSANSIAGGMENIANSSPTLNNVTFSNNSAANQGGGVFNSQSSPTLTNVTFSNNSTNSNGGGMFNQNNASPTLNNVTFSNNSANGNGGGMYTEANSSPTLTNVTFSNNSANGNGGGMFNLLASPTLSHVTFFNNSANGNGGGMYNTTFSSPTLTNCLLWGSSIHHISNTLTVRNTSLEGGLAAITGGGAVTDGGGNNGDMPVFVNAADPDGADDTFRTTDDGLQLAAGVNPAVDTGLTIGAGAALMDILGIARPQGAGFDRGAYERP